MKIGVITDIHNNLPALEAVLPLLSGCETIVCCGDVIGIGPHPEQVVRRLMRVPNLIAVRGNHDRYLLEGMSDAECMGADEMAMHRWEHARLSAESVAFLRRCHCGRNFRRRGCASPPCTTAWTRAGAMSASRRIPRPPTSIPCSRTSAPT